MTTEALGVDPKDCVYLDDLGVNLKPARELGMITIKVLNAYDAFRLPCAGSSIKAQTS
jgi:putative hydrolase of the HAD superfamily